MKNKERIYKTKDISNKLLGIEKAQGIVEIAINAFNNIDYDGDVSDPTSFNRTTKNNISKIKHLAFHDTHKVIGLPIEFKITPEHIVAVSKINLENTIAKDVFANYMFFQENDRSLEHSIGAIMIDNYYDNEMQANIVKEWELREYSVVAFGANPNTPTLSVKELEKMLSYEFSDSTLKNIEKFLSLLNKYQIEDPTEFLGSFENTLKNRVTLNSEDFKQKLSVIFTNLKQK